MLRQLSLGHGWQGSIQLPLTGAHATNLHASTAFKGNWVEVHVLVYSLHELTYVASAELRWLTLRGSIQLPLTEAHSMNLHASAYFYSWNLHFQIMFFPIYPKKMVCDFFLTRCVMGPSPIYQFYLRHSPKIELSQEGLKGWILTKSENLNISVIFFPGLEIFCIKSISWWSVDSACLWCDSSNQLRPGRVPKCNVTIQYL